MAIQHSVAQSNGVAEDTLYGILGIMADASDESVVAAFQKKMEVLDAQEGLDSETYKRQAFLLRLARKILSDPVKRSQYDAGLATDASRATKAREIPRSKVRASSAGSGRTLFRGLMIAVCILAVGALAYFMRAKPEGKIAESVAPVAVSEPPSSSQPEERQSDQKQPEQKQSDQKQPEAEPSEPLRTEAVQPGELLEQKKQVSNVQGKPSLARKEKEIIALQSRLNKQQAQDEAATAQHAAPERAAVEVNPAAARKESSGVEVEDRRSTAQKQSVALPKYRNLDEAMWALDVNAAEKMLDDGADPNARTADGVPPLMRAVRLGNVALIRILLNHGANPNATDRNGNAVIVAAKTAREPSREIIDLLLQAGAKNPFAGK